MIQINLQELYNITSVLGFGICMFKIYKLEQAIKKLKNNQFIQEIASISIVKQLIEKKIIEEDKEIRIN